MQALTDTALSHFAIGDLLRELLGRVSAVMGVDNVAIFLLDDDGWTLKACAARGLLEETVGRARIVLGQGLAGRIAASREPLIVDDTSAFDLEGMPPHVRERLRSMAGVPLLVEDVVEGNMVSRLIGVLNVGSAAPRHFTEADEELLQRAADRIALAIARARLYAAEHDARRQAEEALARAQASEAQATKRAEELRTILDTMADGVVMYNAEGHLTQMNRAYRDLYAVERAPAGYESLPPGERARLLDMRRASGAPLPFEDLPIGRALRGEVVTGLSTDSRARAFDGRELELNASAAPVRDGDGHVAGAVLVLRDVTWRNRLEREREAATASELAAREAGRRMEAFLAVAAHDLRSPLTAVVGYLGLAQRQSQRLASAVRETHPHFSSKMEDVVDRLDDAAQSAKRLTRLLTVLFDTAAIRADRLELHRVPLRPRRAGARAGRGCARGGSGSGHPNAHPPARRADPGRGRHRPPGAGGHQLPHQRAQILPAGSPSGRFRGGEQGPGAGSGA